jgi:hypothetical protein
MSGVGMNLLKSELESRIAETKPQQLTAQLSLHFSILQIVWMFLTVLIREEGFPHRPAQARLNFLLFGT